MPKNNRRSKRRAAKRDGGSIMVPKEREGYEEGSKASTAEFAQGVAEENERIARSYKDIKKEVGDISPEAIEWLQKEAVEKAMEKAMKTATEKHDKKPLAEGGVPREGLMAMPQEMPEEIPEEPMDEVSEEALEDTYANATPEEIEEAQVPDEQMEEEHLVFILNEALAPEEQQYLLQILEEDPQLSQIFDKVVDTASEFSGSGEVTGPGNGISDSIPARLSDGEFVMTQKATEELGADNLQTMMDDAERAYDGGMMRKNRYLGGSIQDDENDLELEDSTGDDIRKLMSIKANKTPSLR